MRLRPSREKEAFFSSNNPLFFWRKSLFFRVGVNRKQGGGSTDGRPRRGEWGGMLRNIHVNLAEKGSSINKGTCVRK